MNALAQLKFLYHLAISPIRGETHQERLDSFYSGQAELYDATRQRMLHGRDELFASLPVTKGDRWVDLGCGTAHNAERFGERLAMFESATLVDLSESLLAIAQKRVTARGWSNVRLLHGDATKVEIPDASVDLVTFAYSLTMIPNWFAAVDLARRILKPGGTIGVVDFYVAKKYPEGSRKRHGWLMRNFWPVWFSNDNVFPSADHIPYLAQQFETVSLSEHTGKLPWLPLVRVPYYYYVGRKPLA